VLKLGVDKLVRLAAAGGGFEVDAGRMHLMDIVKIVAASKPNARIVVKNAEGLHIDDLVRISAASEGSAFFE